jgi:hypothetical protein
MSDDIRAALQKLDPKNDAHWTEDGLPALAALGFKKQPSRSEVTNAAPKFTRALQDITTEAAKAQVEPEDVVVEAAPDDEAALLAALKADADAAEAEMNELAAVVEVARQKFLAAQERHTEVVRKLEQTAHHRAGLENMLGIQRVLETHKAERAAQAELAMEIRRAGISPRLMQAGSAIDNAMARKRGHGQNRPVHNLTART